MRITTEHDSYEIPGKFKMTWDTQHGCLDLIILDNSIIWHITGSNNAVTSFVQEAETLERLSKDKEDWKD